MPSYPACYLRYFNAYPSSICLDCALQPNHISKNLMYRDLTSYKLYAAKEYTLSLSIHGQKETLYTEEICLLPDRVYTLIIYPLSTAPLNHPLSIHCFLMNEPFKKIPEERLLARATNLTLYQEPLKLHFIDCHPDFKKLLPEHSTSYLAFSSNIYALELYDFSSKKVLFKQEHITLKTLRYYHFFIIGGTPHYPIQVITTIEGNSLFHFSSINSTS